jgi:hypothetical protein
MLKYLLVLGFAIAFGAGLVIGLEQRSAVQATPTTTQASRDRGSSVLRTMLNLRPDQQEEMRKIWEAVRPPGREQPNKRDQLKRLRDEQIAALIRPEDKDKYAQILKSYAEGQEQINREIQNSFREAEEATKKILDPDQLQKYEQFLRTHRGPDHGGPGPGPHQRDSNRRGDDRATSRPGSDK